MNILLETLIKTKQQVNTARAFLDLAVFPSEAWHQANEKLAFAIDKASQAAKALDDYIEEACK